MMLYEDDPYLSEETARHILKPFETRIRECIERAWEAVVALRKDTAHDLLARALDQPAGHPFESIMNAAVVQAIQDEFCTDPEVELRSVCGFLELRIGGIIDLRYKKVDRSGRSSNAPTRADAMYRNQLPLNEDDDAQTARVTIGYRWDAAAVLLENVSAVYAKGSVVMWKFEIEPAAAAATQIRVDQPETDSRIKKQSPYRQAGAADSMTRKKEEGA